MKIKFLAVAFFVWYTNGLAQQQPALSVEKIMQDPKWMGSSPGSIYWSPDGVKLYFSWNPDKMPSDSLYAITTVERSPMKVGLEEKVKAGNLENAVFNSDRSASVYTSGNSLVYRNMKNGQEKIILHSSERKSSLQFAFSEKKVVYALNQNLFSWDINSGETIQLINFKEKADRGAEPRSEQETWLLKDQLETFEVLRQRKENREKTENYNKQIPKALPLRTIITGEQSVQNLQISPDGRYISYRLMKPSGARSTIVPNYVTESGFTTDIPARPKVGAVQAGFSLYMFDRIRDTIFQLIADSIPGIGDLPAYLTEYPSKSESIAKKQSARTVFFSGLSWSPSGAYLVVEIRSIDNKDRWLLRWSPEDNRLLLLDRQRDEAWIQGPGINIARTGWINEQTFWYQSEVSGYSHLYTVDVVSFGKRALTSGSYEVQQAQLSNDKKYFYIRTNEVHPGEQHFYRLSISDGNKEKLTTMEGANHVTLSPDEKWMAIRHSFSNKPWELYLQEIVPPGRKTKKAAQPSPIQITFKGMSEEFARYPWKVPEVIQFTARDGAQVYARLYKPLQPHPGKPAVLFVHGAGYLQNAHKWWSDYFREYMFNNLLADNGYYVMDIDYRGSAGYGRDWRTGIYRHMGGKDLTDHVDAVEYLVKTHGVNPANVGIYGGSYGGFITLMGMFTAPDVFAAGAALRPVTDWAQYNHGYTSNILNEPYKDSIAYRRSSPIYFADGLKGHLLICHGMLDVNVHYQDAVKLSQRLIELGKDNWELASYPMEDHAFTEPSSWTDEYKRIFKLFENVLKSPTHIKQE